MENNKTTIYSSHVSVMSMKLVCFQKFDKIFKVLLSVRGADVELEKNVINLHYYREKKKKKTLHLIFHIGHSIAVIDILPRKKR